VIASIESQLGGRAEFDWRSEGLVCRLSVPLAGNFAAPEAELQQEAIIDRTAAGRASRSADA
jgi:hypothetical protein